jgi:alkanesulfonate monooxygenase SsuD/methylene tetrahydromethanopterin reductase-like flavin-dependent oxidoreductase (luciferase family)
VNRRRVPLSVLDLVPVASGSTAAEAVHNSIDLARRVEALGYHRYWFAEHHLNPGVAGTAPAVMIGLAAAATRAIRVGSAGVQLGHRTPLSVVEEFGLLDCAYPGRLDLGLGRSQGARRRTSGTNGAAVSNTASGQPQTWPETAAGVTVGAAPTAAGPDHEVGVPTQARREPQTVDGVLIPSPPPLERLRHSPRVALTRDLLQQPEAITPGYTDQIGDILALLRGEYRSHGLEAHVTPGEGAGVQVWILGSSAGESAEVAGNNALRFAANYHVSPATILDAVQAYRAAFCPGSELERPYVCVSVDVVVADDDRQARRLAAGYGLWVLGIRSGEGAIPFPTEQEAAAHRWKDQDRELVADRVPTQIVGSPSQVVEQLERLVAVTGADELAVTTMTHGHADRVRSYELLAEHWGVS